MPDAERTYMELLYLASKKYAAWDPEITMEVGDWGEITKGRACSSWAFWKKKGSFVKYGNIYKDGKAERYGIPPPREYGVAPADGVTWISSENAEEISAGAEAIAQYPGLAECKVKAGFKFSSGTGAVLGMNEDSIFAIDPPGSVRRLLKCEETRGLILVTEVHRCSSYARFLSASTDNSIFIGLNVSVPPLNGANVNPEAKWVSSSYAGNFKTKSSQTKDYTPLYRLVSLKEEDESTGIESVGIFSRLAAGLGGGGNKDEQPLPDLPFPWAVEEKAEEKESASKEPETTEEHGLFGKLRRKSKGKEPVAAAAAPGEISP